MKRKSVTTLLMGFMLIFILLISVGGIAQAAPQQQPTTHRVYVSNVWEGGFTVSWTTDAVSDGSDGHVDYGTTIALGSTASDAIAGTTTHYVEVSGLSASTTYLFQTRSVDINGTTTDDNGGAFYSVTTGIVLGGTPGSHNLWGYLLSSVSSGSNPVPNAIVYLQVQDADGTPALGNSAWASARTNGSGIWFYNLLNIRTADGSDRFAFNAGTDNVRLVWQGGDSGAVGEVGNEDIRLIPAADTRIDRDLDDNPTAVEMHSFGLRTNTSTPVWVWIGVALLTVFILMGVRRFAGKGVNR